MSENQLLDAYEKEFGITGDDEMDDGEDEAAIVQEINLIKQKSEQAKTIADESELMLVYRESVDNYMDKGQTTKAIEDRDKRIEQEIAKLSKSDPNYDKKCEKIKVD